MKKKLFVFGTEVVLEKKSPPKPGTVRVGSVWDELLTVIKKGDSFLIPYKPSYLNSLYIAGRKRGYRIASRREVHQGVKKLRVYRVK